MIVLDSGAVTHLARHLTDQRTLQRRAREHGTAPVVPSVVLVECLTGHGPRDALVNRFLHLCSVEEHIPQALARRAALLRARARRGSAVDALVVALAEPGGVVLTGDLDDLAALAAYADEVSVERV